MNVPTSTVPKLVLRRGGLVTLAAFLIASIGSSQAGGRPITRVAEIIGSALSVIEFAAPTGIVVDAQGNTYVASGNQARIWKITADGTASIFFTTSGFPVSIAQATDMVIDPTGNLYVGTRLPQASHVFKITPQGNHSIIIGPTGAGGTSSLCGVWGVDIDDTGNVYCTGSVTDNAFKITPSGVITEIINPQIAQSIGKLLDQPTGIAVDSIGNVFVAGELTNNVFKITPQGAVTEIVDILGAGIGPNGSRMRLRAPQELCVDGDDNLYIAGKGSNNVLRVTPGTVITEIIRKSSLEPHAPLRQPAWVDVDGFGNVYVSGLFSQNAFRITPSGVIMEIIDNTGDRSGNRLSAPKNLFVDDTGNCYLSGNASHNAFRIGPMKMAPVFAPHLPTGPPILATPFLLSTHPSPAHHAWGDMAY